MAVRRTNYKVLEDGTRYGEYACLSTDDKPVEIGLATGSLALEVDTGDVYAYDEEGAEGSEWVKICALGGSGT